MERQREREINIIFKYEDDYKPTNEYKSPQEVHDEKEDRQRQIDEYGHDPEEY